jgi:hypothetical protein
MEREEEGFLPDPLVAKRYSVNPRTLARWDEQPDLKFPPPEYVNRRKYRSISKLKQWDLWRAAGGGGKATRKPSRVPSAKHEAEADRDQAAA